MTIELDLLLKLIPILIAGLALWRTYRRDVAADTGKIDAAVRALQDAMIRMESFQRERQDVPGRLVQLETHAARVSDMMDLLRSQLPRLLRDVSRGERMHDDWGKGP